MSIRPCSGSAVVYHTDRLLSEPGHVPGAESPDVLVDLNRAGSAGTPGLTVLVPTRNEEENVGPLLARLGAAVAELGAEILIVDDSDDDTPDVLAEAPGLPGPVRLLHRPPDP